MQKQTQIATKTEKITELSIDEILNKLQKLVPKLLPLSIEEQFQPPTLKNNEAFNQARTVLILCDRLSAKIMTRQQKNDVVNVLKKLIDESFYCKPVHQKFLSLKKDFKKKFVL